MFQSYFAHKQNSIIPLEYLLKKKKANYNFWMPIKDVIKVSLCYSPLGYIITADPNVSAGLGSASIQWRPQVGLRIQCCRVHFYLKLYTYFNKNDNSHPSIISHFVYSHWISTFEWRLFCYYPKYTSLNIMAIFSSSFCLHIYQLWRFRYTYLHKFQTKPDFIPRHIKSFCAERDHALCVSHTEYISN